MHIQICCEMGTGYAACRSLEDDLIETIKYGAKIFTEPDLDKKMQSDANPTIYAAALYNIYEGMKG